MVMNEKQEKFIEQVAEGVKDRWEQHQLLPSVAIAQAILESSWGSSDLAVKANNLFGVKGDYNGYGYLKESWEVIDGKDITIESWFKHYPSWAESIKDQTSTFHGSDWRKNHYKNVIGEKNYEKATQALTGTYATDPNYGTKLKNIIEAYELTKYDPVFEEPEKENEELKRLRITNLPNKEVANFFLAELKSEGISDAYIITEGSTFSIQAGSFRTAKALREQQARAVKAMTNRLSVV